MKRPLVVEADHFPADFVAVATPFGSGEEGDDCVFAECVEEGCFVDGFEDGNSLRRG
jgi:hypothetical protein